jgi:hypothetical protein
MADQPTGQFEHGYTCAQVVELATAYVEQTMPADLLEAFEMHLNFCDGCASFIEQVRKTAELGGRVEEDQISDEEKAKLLEAFRNWRHA